MGGLGEVTDLVGVYGVTPVIEQDEACRSGSLRKAGQMREKSNKIIVKRTHHKMVGMSSVHVKVTIASLGDVGLQMRERGD